MKQPRILIINRHPSLTTSLPSLKKNIRRILDFLKLLDSRVEVTLVDDAFMKKQNRKYMGKSGTTDVLSFPQLPQQKRREAYHGKFLGDILISLDQAKAQADMQGIKLGREVLFLSLHSILHLIGFDHAEEGERIKMQELESRIFHSLTRN